MIPYTPPAFRVQAFNCVHCHAYAHHSWQMPFVGSKQYDRVCIAYCANCKFESIWCDKQLVVPRQAGVPAPNADLPGDIKGDYQEAANILGDSPRGAGALLRLAIQKLMKHLGQKGENLNDDIAKLVKQGLSPRVQQALDALRVIGNDCVHPGQIDLRDDPETAAALFGWLNYIAEQMLTQPRELEALYSGLPQIKRDAIAKRDDRAE